MAIQSEITLSYEGQSAEQHQIDFYDASRALIGFQRSLALTTHLVLNDEIITQSPSLMGASILIRAPQEGSWQATALVVIAAAWSAGTVSKDSPIGNLISSVYDYIINAMLGFHVDYSKTLGLQYEKCRKAHPHIKILKEPRLDSLAEKCTSAFVDMHRPVIFSKTASTGTVLDSGNGGQQLGPDLDDATYDFINYNIRDDRQSIYCGSIAAYSSNAFSGRMYMPSERRLISFSLTENARTSSEIAIITRSLAINAQQNESHTERSKVYFSGYKITSKNGRLKKIVVIDVLKDV